jgi:hypothetical protein
MSMSVSVCEDLCLCLCLCTCALHACVLMPSIEAYSLFVRSHACGRRAPDAQAPASVGDRVHAGKLRVCACVAASSSVYHLHVCVFACSHVCVYLVSSCLHVFMSSYSHVCMSACILCAAHVWRTLGCALSACIVDSRTNVIERDVGVDVPE